MPVEIHWLFALLLVWVAVEGWGNSTIWANLVYAPGELFSDPDQLREFARAAAEGLRSALYGVGLLVLIFVCVLIHEIGHSLHAQALGIPVRRILLLPIGGLAELARMPDRPVDELRVALAGPAANLGLAFVFGAGTYAGLLAADLSLPMAMRLALHDGLAAPLAVLLNLTVANLGITLFNLLPAFPMDGGRILRGLLALAFQRLTATRIVSGLSWAFGGAFVVAGLGAARRWDIPSSLGLVLIGLFTLIGAGVEKSMEENRLALGKIVARTAVRQPTWTLSPTDVVAPSLNAAFYLHSVLPVVVGPRIVGVLARQDLAEALNRHGGDTVAHIMRTRFPYVRADEDLWRAQQLLITTGAAALPVLDGESLHGMLTPADIRAARVAPPAIPPVEAPTFISGGNPIS